MNWQEKPAYNADMHPLNQLLRETFLFSSRDLLANRAGKLSKRQQARQQAAGVSLKYGIAFFVVVMLGTLGVIAFFTSVSGANEGASQSDVLVSTGIVVGVIFVILVLSLLSSRRHLAATKEKQIQKAEGEAGVGKVRSDAAQFELKLGRKKIRLVTQEQLESFKVGESYRVYFLPGPIPTILSAEVLGTEAEAEQFLEPEEDNLQDDEMLKRHQRARPIVVVLAVLTLGIPLAGFAATMLPGVLRYAAMFGLLVLSIGFVFWALRRTS